MYETEDDLVRLQELLDRTLARANPHLTSIVSPERRLSARQVVRYLQGTKHVAFATVNERGVPRVAPLDGVFVHGRFTVSTGGRAARLRHLRANPACSAVHMDGDAVGIAVNGQATILARDDAGVDEIERIWREIYGSSPFEWGEGVAFIVIEPTSMWAYAFHPEHVEFLARSQDIPRFNLVVVTIQPHRAGRRLRPRRRGRLVLHPRRRYALLAGSRANPGQASSPPLAGRSSAVAGV